MTSVARDQREGGPAPELTGSLAYLLKHAQMRLAELTGAALEPTGVTGRELAVLMVLAGREPASQQQAAQRLGVDRTTMVDLLDALEDKALVGRHVHADDRRKNVVEVTAAGRAALGRAAKAASDAEGRFLTTLTQADAKRLKSALLTLIQAGR